MDTEGKDSSVCPKVSGSVAKSEQDALFLKPRDHGTLSFPEVPCEPERENPMATDCLGASEMWKNIGRGSEA